MKWLKFIISFSIISTVVFAQGHHGGGFFNPDSLEVISLSGTAIVDSQFVHPVYYLDEDGDQTADYHLTFGPYWYEPDSSSAVRPQDGEHITISGGLHNHQEDSTLSTVVVYEINNEFWRQPYESYWNNMGGHTMGGGHHQHGGCGGYTFGFDYDSLQTIELTGTTIVDSTFLMLHYYLDSDNDTIPNYFLNFGPPWYEPENNVTRPNRGEEITIVGGIVNDSSEIPMLIVYEINGETWRDSSLITGSIGEWLTKNMTSSHRVHNPFDENDWMEFSPGWHSGGGMGGGHMMPDSVFTQMMELFPGSIPNSHGEGHFAGYEMGFFFPNGKRGMNMFGGCGNMMKFNNDATIQLHYSDKQIEGNNIDESKISVKYWDESSASWKEVESTVVVDAITNTVSFSISNISPYFILTDGAVTSVETEEKLDTQFSLYQNYPNPFNPTTEIKFSLKENSDIRLTIYNVIGQKVADLLNGKFNAGSHSVTFNAAGLPSGIYFYKIETEKFSQTRKMILIK